MIHGERCCQPLGRLDVVGHAQHADRCVRQPEPIIDALGDGAVQAQRLEVQRDEDRVERMLDDPRVAAGRSRSDRGLLEQDDASPALCQVSGSGHADDAATDDRDIEAGLGRQGRATGHGRDDGTPAKTAKPNAPVAGPGRS